MLNKRCTGAAAIHAPKRQSLTGLVRVDGSRHGSHPARRAAACITAPRSVLAARDKQRKPISGRGACWASPPAAPEPAAAEAPDALYDWAPSFFTDGSQQPQEYVGPIEVRDIPGKGRGVFTTQALPAGTLLLVTPSLAMVTGEMGEIPELEDLVTTMEEWARYDPWQATWLRALYRGPREASQAAPIPINNEVPAAAALPPLASPAARTPTAGDGGSSSDGSSEGSLVSLEGVGLEVDEVWRATALNCFGEDTQDLALAQARGEPLSSLLGVWPTFSMINHACAPNAVNYVVGTLGFMAVRSTRPLAPGEEVTINYLGRGALRPASQRQAELEASYGFTCACTRCQLETGGAVGRLVAPQLNTLFKSLGEDWAPRYQAAFTLVQLPRGDQDQEEGGSGEATGSQEQGDSAANSSTSSTPGSSSSPAPAAAAASDPSSSGSAAGEESPAGITAYKADAEALYQLLDEVRKAWWQLQQLTVMPLGSSSSSGGGSSSSSGSPPDSADVSAVGASSSSNTAVSSLQEEQQLWLQSSAYDVLGLMHAICEAIQDEAEDELVLDRLLRVVEAVAPGSDLHAFQALRWLVVAQVQHGPDTREDAAAQQRLAGALLARYGPGALAEGSTHAAMAEAVARAAGMVEY